MLIEQPGPRYLVLMRRTEPGIGSHTAIVVESNQVNARDNIHWQVVFDGTDAAAFNAACHAAGITTPTN